MTLPPNNTTVCPLHGQQRIIVLPRPPDAPPGGPLMCCIKCVAAAMVQPVRRSQAA
jgi:hypothetical protein